MDPINQRILEDIRATGGTLFGAVSRKKDGSIMHRTYNFRAGENAVKGTAPEATARRRETNPNLVPLWSVTDGGYRNVNLDTVYSIRAKGVTTRYRERE